MVLRIWGEVRLVAKLEDRYIEIVRSLDQCNQKDRAFGEFQIDYFIATRKILRRFLSVNAKVNLSGQAPYCKNDAAFTQRNTIHACNGLVAPYGSYVNYFMRNQWKSTDQRIRARRK